MCLGMLRFLLEELRAFRSVLKSPQIVITTNARTICNPTSQCRAMPLLEPVLCRSPTSDFPTGREATLPRFHIAEHCVIRNQGSFKYTQEHAVPASWFSKSHIGSFIGALSIWKDGSFMAPFTVQNKPELHINTCGIPFGNRVPLPLDRRNARRSR